MARVIYNDLSEKLKKQLKWDEPLKDHEVVQFQWLNIPVIKQSGQMLPFYSLKRLPNVDHIYDPWAEGGPKMVAIAYVVNEIANTEAKPKEGLGEVEFSKGEKCVITISGRDIKKRPLLNYLRAHSANASNPHANPGSQGFLFKELEPAKTAEQKLKERKELTMCENYIYDLKDTQVVSFLSALKQRTYPTPEENMSALIEYVQVKSQRDKFNALSTDARTPVAALIAKAKDKDLIRYESDPKTWIYVETKKVITQVPPHTDPEEHIVGYFHNNINGKAMKEFLEKEIEAMEAERAKVNAKAAIANNNKK
jgi:hypothetical protein